MAALRAIGATSEHCRDRLESGVAETVVVRWLVLLWQGVRAIVVIGMAQLL
ncbi:MAG: hypothetical protein NZ772_08355 [Cyanobacteria bacterium]|nr:hypothetical protein [Cyanobacteriota bacterium]MDW8200182.1 hypothetical protein [Cyanobacteriota bacterium SKYGB_h_bin112]